MKRKVRKIDQLVGQAVKWLGSFVRLFEEAAKSAFGKFRDAKVAKAALDRYLKRGSLAEWVKSFVMKGTYLRIPA